MYGAIERAHDQTYQDKTCHSKIQSKRTTSKTRNARTTLDTTHRYLIRPGREKDTDTAHSATIIHDSNVRSALDLTKGLGATS